MSAKTETFTWPELAIGLYDKLTERHARINYQFDDFEIAVPSSTSGQAQAANWKLSGTLRVSTGNEA